MSEMQGVLAAILSSAIGGTAIGSTRFLAGLVDPSVIGAIRFGGGFIMLAPIAILLKERWPPRRDWPGVAALGLLFFAIFPLLFNASLIFTTAARAALALSTLPVLTMIAAALLGVEALTSRKTVGVAIAMGGVVATLGVSASTAPIGAWRGDLLMAAAALCMALYNVWSRPFVARSSATTFAAAGMGVGGLALLAYACASGELQRSLDLMGWRQAFAGLYLAVFGGAVNFYLWAFALGRTTPTRVAISITVNPITATVTGALLVHEAIRWSLAVGLLAVFCGIWIATTSARDAIGRRDPDPVNPRKPAG